MLPTVVFALASTSTSASGDAIVDVLIFGLVFCVFQCINTANGKNGMQIV